MKNTIFYIFLCLSIGLTTPLLSQTEKTTPQTEETAAKAALEQNTIEAYEAFLKNYPDSPNTPTIEEKLAVLKAKEKAKAEKLAQAKAERQRRAAEAEKKRSAEENPTALKELLAGPSMNQGKTSQGDPTGDSRPPKELNRVITSRVGGGLSNRGIKAATKPETTSTATGILVYNVCVDQSGNVISAKYSLGGSTSSDTELKQAALENAKNWKFSEGTLDKQCGTITYNFK